MDPGRVGQLRQNRRAKFYQLTRAGRLSSRPKPRAWGRLTTAVSLVLAMG